MNPLIKILAVSALWYGVMWWTRPETLLGMAAGMVLWWLLLCLVAASDRRWWV